MAERRVAEGSVLEYCPSVIIEEMEASQGFPATAFQILRKCVVDLADCVFQHPDSEATLMHRLSDWGYAIRDWAEFRLQHPVQRFEPLVNQVQDFDV